MASLELCLITPPQKLFNEDWQDSTRSAVYEQTSQRSAEQTTPGGAILTIRTFGGLFGTTEV